jgi:hypothetical protein
MARKVGQIIARGDGCKVQFHDSKSNGSNWRQSAMTRKKSSRFLRTGTRSTTRCWATPSQQYQGV